VIGTALAVTTVLYLGLAIAAIAVLGRGAATDVPLAGLLTRAIGGEGRLAAAVVAVVLTLGTTNAYLSGAVAMAREFRWRQPGQAARWQRRAAPPPVMSGRLADHGPSGHGVRSGHGVPSDHPQRRADYLEGQAQHPERPAGHGSERAFLAVIAAVGVILLALYGAGLVTAAELVGVPTTLFLVVYLCCTLSAARTLRGAARGCAVAAFAAVAGLLAFCGWSLALAAVVTIAALYSGGRRHPRGRFRLRS
jgi:amino acid efflux transporter